MKIASKQTDNLETFADGLVVITFEDDPDGERDAERCAFRLGQHQATFYRCLSTLIIARVEPDEVEFVDTMLHYDLRGRST